MYETSYINVNFFLEKENYDWDNKRRFPNYDGEWSDEQKSDDVTSILGDNVKAYFHYEFSGNHCGRHELRAEAKQGNINQDFGPEYHPSTCIYAAQSRTYDDADLYENINSIVSTGML